jgi:hypothetical protein
MTRLGYACLVALLCAIAAQHAVVERTRALCLGVAEQAGAVVVQDGAPTASCQPGDTLRFSAWELGRARLGVTRWRCERGRWVPAGEWEV